MIMIDFVYRLFASGGWVILPIFMVGSTGFYLLVNICVRLEGDLFRRHQMKNMEALKHFFRIGDIDRAKKLLNRTSGPQSVALAMLIEYRHLPILTLRKHLQEKLSIYSAQLDRGIHFVMVLAVSAPLFGLLGTVSGMIHTFELLTAHGNSNPTLLAGGISEALIATQSGLVIAFPLVLISHWLEDRINWIRKQMELGITELLNEWPTRINEETL